MKNDALDVVLRNMEDNEDWQGLCKIYDCESQAKLETSSQRQLIKFFNKKIRHNYGHTLANIVRDEYAPDYDDILKATAEHLSIDHIPEKLTIRDIEHLENSIIAKVLEDTKESIIKKEGVAAWEKIEREAMNEIDKLYADGKINTEDYGILKASGLSGSLLAAIAAGRMTGFALYMVVNQMFFAISRYLGLSIGVAVAGPIIGRSIAFILGPAGWFLSLIPVIYELGNTKWKETMCAVMYIAGMRKKQCYLLD